MSVRQTVIVCALFLSLNITTSIAQLSCEISRIDSKVIEILKKIEQKHNHNHN
jgi:hypothetical protein